MHIFSKLYDLMIRWAGHRHAPYYLGFISFIESSVFPIPPDVMLAPMALAKPERAWWYATITTVFSILGALLGYVIGMFFLNLALPLITQFGYLDAYEKVKLWFDAWGVWVLFIAAVSPIPFKLFTIAGGAMHMALFPFIAVSFLGRGMRFYLVAGLMRWGGARMDKVLRRTVDWIGWTIVILLVLGIGIYKGLQ